MSKLIAQAFLSLMVSLGLVAGANPNVRGEVKQVWQETKAIARQTVDFATSAATDLASQVAANADVEAEASTETAADVYFGEDSRAGVEIDTQAEGSAEAETEDGINLNFEGDADTGLKIDLGFWR